MSRAEGLDPSAVYDALGRKQPRRLGFLAFARGIPGFAARFDREVPQEFQTATERGVTVTCPCGERPSLEPVQLVACACGRSFVYTGRQVLVASA